MAKTKLTRGLILEKATLISAFVEPAISLPQVWQVFRTRSAEDISLISWVGWQAVSVLWLMYGFHKKDKPIIIYHGLFIVVQTAVIVGKIIYG